MRTSCDKKIPWQEAGRMFIAHLCCDEFHQTRAPASIPKQQAPVAVAVHHKQTPKAGLTSPLSSDSTKCMLIAVVGSYTCAPQGPSPHAACAPHLRLQPAASLHPPVHQFLMSHSHRTRSSLSLSLYILSFSLELQIKLSFL